MIPIIIKILKDLRFSPGKVLLMVLAAALSTWGISSVLYSYVMSERDFTVNFSRIYSADIELAVDQYSEGLEEAILSDPNVIDIERREVIGGRIKDLNGNWMPLVLFVVEDINNLRYDQFRILEEDDSNEGKILIEKNALFFLKDDQENIEVQIPGKGDITWKIGGTAHDARLAPARMERVIYAYATSLDLVQPFLNKNRRRLLIETNVSMSLSKLQLVTKRLEEVVNSYNSKLLYYNIPKPDEHIHQNIVDGISFLQRNSGFIISIMGIILLSLILLTWIFPQVVEIGIMKAMGASTKVIFWGYTFALSLIITLGLIIGFPFGMKTASLYNRLVAGIQNFEVVKDTFPLGIHLIIVLICILIPLSFGMYHLYKASKTTVNEAMNKTFYIPGKGIFNLTQNLISSDKLKYAVNNMFRNSQRTILIIFLIAVGVSLYFTGSNLEYSIREELSDFQKTANYDFSMKLSKPMIKGDINFLYELPFIDKIAFAKEKRITFQPANVSFTKSKTLRVLSTNHTIPESFVLKGKLDKSCANCIYISGESMKEDFENIPLGTTVVLTEDKTGEAKSFVYSGIFKSLAAIGSAFYRFDDHETQAFNAIDFEIKDGVSEQEAANAVDDALLENGIDIRGMLSVERRLASFQGHFEPTYLIIKAIGMFTVVLGLLGLFIVLNLTLQERIREIGIMKSLGATLMKISAQFRFEFLVMVLAAMVFGVVIAMPLTSGMCDVITKTVIHHHIPPRSDFMFIISSTLTILLILGFLISVYTYFKIKKNARELLDHHF